MNRFYKLALLLAFITYPIVALGESGMVLIQYDLNGQEQWVQYPGDQAGIYNGITVTSSNKIYVSGNYSLLLACYNLEGALIWDKKIGVNDPFLLDISSDQDENAYVLSHQYLFLDQYAFKLTKTNSTGLEEWTIFWNEFDIEYAYLFGNILIDSTGSPVLVINFTDENDNELIGAIKYNSNGQLSWFQSYGQSKSGIDYPLFTTLDSEDSLFIAGVTYDSDVLLKEDILLLKYDSNGLLLWNKTIQGFGDSSLATIDEPAGVVVDMENNIILGANSNEQGKIYKYNSQGGLLWEYSILNNEESLNYNSKRINFVALDKDDNIFYISEKNIDDMIISILGKLTLEGELLWERSLSESFVQIPVGLQIFENGNVVFLLIECGQYSEICEYTIGMIDASGKLTWKSSWDGKTLRLEHDDHSSFLEIGPSGNIYILGYSRDHSGSESDDDNDQSSDDDDDDSSGCGC